MKKTFLILLIGSMLCYPATVHAQLLMEKSRVQETVEPGDTLVDSITLHNKTDAPMELTVYWEDFEY